MKKIAILVFALLFCFASGVFAKDNIRFIYIHGTNDNNYSKKIEFKHNVEGIHPYIIEQFNSSTYAQKYLLKDGKSKILPRPVPYYWGGESKEDLNVLNDWLDVTKFFSPKLAQTVRRMLAYTLHDAIWIQKYNNMKPVLDKLSGITNVVTKRDHDKYILFGHSAGSFIAYEYLLYKLPFFNTKMIYDECDADNPNLKVRAKKLGYQNTCLDALINSGLAVYRRDNELYLLEKNFEKNYKNLAKATQTSCVSGDQLAGVVIFGTPITLFYSGFVKSYQDYTVPMYQYMVDNNIFLIAINFAEDPLGFPILSEDDYSQATSVQSGRIKGGHYGFVSDKSNIRSNVLVAKAHSAYWTKKKLFSKSIVNAYNDSMKQYESLTEDSY